MLLTTPRHPGQLAGCDDAHVAFSDHPDGREDGQVGLLGDEAGRGDHLSILANDRVQIAHSPSHAVTNQLREMPARELAVCGRALLILEFEIDQFDAEFFGQRGGHWIEVCLD